MINSIESSHLNSMNVYQTSSVFKSLPLHERVTKNARIVYLNYKDISEKHDLLSHFNYKKLVKFSVSIVNNFYEEIYIEYPFELEQILCSYQESIFLRYAKKVAKLKSLDRNHPTAAVFVKNNTIVAFAPNGSDYHLKYGCPRKLMNIPSGEGYDLCEGCHTRNHSEIKAIRIAEQKNGIEELNGSTVFLYGHWRPCSSCYTSMQNVGVEQVIMSKNWTKKWLDI